MRLKSKPGRRRKANSTLGPVVRTPHMAQRPRSGTPDQTLLMDAVRENDDPLTRKVPAVSPAAVLPPYPHTAFTPISGHPAPMPPLDATQVLPVIREQKPATDPTATQVLPKVTAELPPSARHVDPARLYYQRTFVEDDGMDPQARGRHVLDELTSEPDVAALVAVQQRAHTVLDVYDPMRRAENAARANDERMRAFVAQWDARQDRDEREFESWAGQFRKALAATRARWAETSGRTNANRLELDYKVGGTSAALYTKDQLAAEIARRDAAGSGQHR